MNLRVTDLRSEYVRNPLGIGPIRPRLSWKLEAGTGERHVLQTAYQIQVAKEDPDFNRPIRDSGKIESDRSVHVEYGGEPLEERTRYYARVRAWDRRSAAADWSGTVFWETGIFREDSWQASWITCDAKSQGWNEDAAYLLRRGFRLDGEIVRARVYATSLGAYRLELNGRKAGDGVLAPGWTSYNKRLQVQTYDVTEFVAEGDNTVGVVLAKGWHQSALGWENNNGYYGSARAALVQLHVLYKDGREAVICSDESWQAATGPVLMSEIYDGEIYDARLEIADWAKPGTWNGEGYDAEISADTEIGLNEAGKVMPRTAGWKRASVVEYPKSMLVCQENELPKVMHELKPAAFIVTPAGETVIDFGQNMVGAVRFTVRGATEGAVAELRHFEVLDRNGNVYTANLRKAKQTAKYICRGGVEETYQPEFTFMGFRYVHVVQYPGEINLDDFTGCVIYSGMEATGTFACSDEQVSKLQQNIVWGQRGNFLDVPTDCPQRDERLGWTGDAQVFIRTAAFNMGVGPFFTKWLRDLKADQLPDGGVPAVIPNIFPESAEMHSSSAWGDAAVICPWTLYLCYGDTRILEEQFDSMKAWIDYIRGQGEQETLWNTGFHFGDWLHLNADSRATPTDLIATAYFAYSTDLFARSAALIGRREIAGEYRDLHRRIVDAFRQEFVTPSGRLCAHTQTAHVLALAFGLVEGETKTRVARTLAAMIEDNGTALTTGFVGTPYLCRVLTENGYNELAYRLVLRKEYPSWLYSVGKGATTIWEHWDSIKEDGSFWSEEMNSFNHYAYGSVGEWLYGVVAGIDTSQAEPGYKGIVIHPRPGKGITSAEAAYDSMYGTIRSSWSIQSGRMRMDVTIPPNTTATIVLPAADPETVKESDIDAASAEGILFVEKAAEGVKVRAGSGQYRFEFAV
ncbi:family 78 glycoside hydrolase catalytic domain [Paenibacillus sp. VCA1]|uniref:family 78 glycoside hydrolase catalytic domain n=1 Tax=Paenibacillus sp. VCA1 TaxID=3039148 RepID=UPI0028725295|nr:family 78 glycoside hydrolase catalytic domain [Paenibacillus sp. VCA1]MDR9856160.1 family 78 glycoside hydrolase catalytic domain [Paenibacillus sp. VCA1]